MELLPVGLGRSQQTPAPTVTFPVSIHVLTVSIVGASLWGWSPGCPHGSHTPNRGVVEAVAAQLPFAIAEVSRVRELACCDEPPDDIDKHALVLQWASYSFFF